MNKSAIKKNQFNFHHLFGTINWALVHVCPRVDNVLLSQQHWPLSHNSTFDQFPIFQWLSQRRCENESICRFLATVYGSLSRKLRLWLWWKFGQFTSVTFCCHHRIGQNSDSFLFSSIKISFISIISFICWQKKNLWTSGIFDLSISIF